MDTVFIINPKAGKAKDIEKLVSDIKNAVNDAEIYMTKASRDATRFVREYCEKHSAARIFAYGGDGTLSEVVNGAVGFDGVEIGIIPSGTGNDFCRNFPDSDFKDLSAQVGGEAIPCDVIRYRTTLNGEEKTGYCINMFNIGFDCNVADMTAKMKKNSFVNGSFAYIISIFTMLIKKNGANLKIELDGKELHSGRLLLNSIANGSFCGGGIMSNPRASVNDGNLNVNIVYNISRINFLSKLPFYMKGTHIKLRNIENVIANKIGKTLKLTPLDGVMRICVDGEIFDAGVTEFDVLPQEIKFIVPTKKVAAKI